MAITAQQVKELRELTGEGMMECKKALNESGGNMEEAKDLLRKQGKAKAAKKAGRIAADGLIAVAISGQKGAVIELNSETDFVAKNEQFQSLASQIAQAAGTTDGALASVQAAKLTDGRTVADAVTDAVANIGEHITLRRSALLQAPEEGVLASYIHNQQAEGLGKIGVIVSLASSGDAGKLAALGKQIAMHVAAAKPLALKPEELDQAEVAREREIFAEQARGSGKPEAIIAKMVEGRLRKYYAEVVLLEQAFVIDGKTRVADVLQAAEAEIGAPVRIEGYAQFTLGEGVEKKEENFAEEVAAAVGA